MGGPRAIERKDVAIAGGLAFAALVLRLIFLIATPDSAWPHSAWYEGDAPVWVEWARALQAGEAFEFDLPVRAPGNAFLLVLLGGDLQAPFTSLKVLWCAMSAATVGLTYLILRGELSRRASVIASSLLAVSFGSYVLSTSLNNETPYLFVVTAAMALGLWQTEKQSFPRAVVRGILHGFGVLLRPEHLVLAVGLLAIDAWQARKLAPKIVRRRRLATAMSAALMVSVCIPWTLRSHAATVKFNTTAPRAIEIQNAEPPWSEDAQSYLFSLPAFAREGNFLMLSEFARRDGTARIERADLERFFESQFGFVPEPLPVWTLSSSKGKLDLALANHLASDGGFSRAALGDKFGVDPEFAFGRASHLKLYLHGDSVVFDTLRSDLPGWLALVRRKFAHFVNGLTLGFGARNLPFAFDLVRRPVDVATPPPASAIWWRATMLVAALAGIVFAWRRRMLSTWSWLLAFRFALTVIFYGYARQGLLAAPAMFAFVGLALDVGIDRATLMWPRAQRITTWIATALVASVVLVDIARFISPVKLEIKPVAEHSKLSPTPEWGAGAFESNQAISIRE